MNFISSINNNRINLPSSNSFTQPQNYPLNSDTALSLVKEPDMQYENTVHYLNISSSDRDTTNYPKQYDYLISLDKIYENTLSVEMISVIFPNSSGITSEPFLVFDIEELNTIDFALSSASHKGFAICPLKNPNQVSGGFVLADFGCMYHTCSVFKTPKKISKLRVRVRDVSGNLYTFGGASVAKQDQHSFVLKIVTSDASRKQLNHRNVY